MSNLVKQPSPWPTRKMTAVIITGAIMGIVRAVSDVVFPGNPFSMFIDQLDASVLMWVDYALTAVPMIVAGWLTKERA